MIRGLALSAAVCTAAIAIPWIAGGPDVAILAAVAVAVQILAWVPAARLQDERFYDATGSVTYLLVVVLALALAEVVSTRAMVMAAMVAVWALRLGNLLVRRAMAHGDARFDAIKLNPVRFLVAWSLQGLWVAVISLPATWAIASGVSTIGPFELLGWALWVVGFTIEALADHQKTVFRSDPSNAGRFITTGLWARSRHPNYFGEVLLWTGLWVTGFAHYTGGAWLTAASPVLSYLLLTRVSGIPMVEARADAKWGDDPAYIAYRDQTPVLVPRL